MNQLYLSSIVKKALMSLEQASWHIAGLRIDEPITTLTDLLVSLVCFYALNQIRKRMPPSTTKTLMAWYFLGMGLATMVGGIAGHAFLYALSPAWKLPGWLFSMLAITAIERVMIINCKPLIPEAWGKFLDKLNILELVVFVGLTIGTLNLHPENHSLAFKYVEIHSAYGLLGVVFTLSLLHYRRTKNKGAKFFMIAVGHCALAAVIFIEKIGIHANFNHADVSHVFMAISAFYFYRGSLHLTEVPVNGWARLKRSRTQAEQ